MEYEKAIDLFYLVNMILTSFNANVVVERHYFCAFDQILYLMEIY